MLGHQQIFNHRHLTKQPDILEGPRQPRPVNQTVLRIKFDEAGNVTSVDRTGLEKIAKVDLENDKTPTLGRKRGFFEDLFGNIGQVGAVGPGGSTTDNPN